MYYLIHQIAVIKHTAGGRDYGKGRWVSFQRNEVCKTVSPRTVQQWMIKPDKFEPIMSGAGSGKGNIAQRNTLALAGVAYLVSAEVCLTDLARSPRDTLQKYKDELKRRAAGGKCYCRPALGCREFAADFDWIDQDEGKLVPRFPWPEEDLGLMLYDVFDPAERQRGFAWFNHARNYDELDYSPAETDAAQKRLHFGEAIHPRACFFPAKVNDGVMECHPENVGICSVPGKQGYNAKTNG